MENFKAKSKNRTLKIIAIVSASSFLLLVVLFIIVVQFSEPKAMTLNLPQTNQNVNHIKLDKDNTITVLLGENNRIIYYVGSLDAAVISPKETVYGENGIRKELILQNKSMLKNSSKPPKSKKIIVIIKPGAKSTYKNLVDILDEMAITNIKNYVIVKEFTPEESKLLTPKSKYLNHGKSA